MAWYNNLFGGGDPRWTTPKAIPQRTDLQMGMRGTPQPDPMNSYFTQLADPRYRKAMQQQNLFSNLLNFGAQMKAAGAPSLDPGYAGRTSAGAWAGLGKGLMSGNQDYRNQMMNAIKLKSMMDTSKLARGKAARDAAKHKMEMRQFEGWYGPEAKETAVTPPQTFGVGTVPTQRDEAIAAGAPTQSTVPKQYQGLLNDDEWARFRVLGPEKGPQAINDYLAKRSPRLDASGIITTERAFATDFDRVTKEARDRMSGYQQLESIFEDPSKMKISKAKLTNKDGQVEPFEKDIFKDKGLEKRGAADLALIFSFMKMLDPRSVVREGEFAQARDTGGQVTSWYVRAKGVLDGNLLGEDERRNLMRVARGQFNAARRHVLSQRDTFEAQAAQYKESGIQPSRMFRFTDYSPRITPEALANPKSDADAKQVG